MPEMLDMLDSSSGADNATESEEVEAPAQSDFPLKDLPPLPRRSGSYRSEPLIGATFVFLLSSLLVGVTQGLTFTGGDSTREFRSIMSRLIWGEALVAVLCVGFLLLSDSGVIRRSRSTCYPIPPEVEERLRESKSLEGLQNVGGPEGSATLGTYCVRCLVWRPPRKVSQSHHCNICQRCVVHFDHHCGVFGRCIVRNNMPCFFAILAMMAAGMATTMVAAMFRASIEDP